MFVVINEIETLASSRQDLSAATNPLDTAFAVNAFLESLDKLATHKGVFILATTNLPDKIDSAVLDRFDDVFEFPKPGASQRLRILSKAIQAIQPSNRVAAMLRHAAASAGNRAVANERCREALIECSRIINATRDLSPRRLSQLPARALGLRSESINSPLTLQHLVDAAKATRRLK